MSNDFFSEYKNLIERLRSDDSAKEFDYLKNQIYLDYAANSVYPSSLVREYSEKLTNHDETKGSWSLFSNPHSHSQSGIYTNLFVDSTRQKILKLFNTNLNEYDVIFVQNATQGLKLLVESFNFDGSDFSENKIENDKSYFAYLNDNHTSVIGLREIVWNSNSSTEVLCISKNDSLEDKLFDIKIIHDHKKKDFSDSLSTVKNNLVIFPAQSNFNGRKYDLDTVEFIKINGINIDINRKNWFVCVDTASYTSTSYLDLEIYKIDFLVVSFYKIFGFPTGIGALIVRKCDEIKKCLNAKKYFGGGTVSMALIDENKVCLKNCSIKRNGLNKIEKSSYHEFFEDGTISYLQIIGLSLAIDKFQNLTFKQGFSLIQNYVDHITEYCLSKMKDLKHFNGINLIEIYRESNMEIKYGPIIAFNLKNYSGNYIGFNLVNNLAQENRIHLRTGCFCNIGACQKFLDHLSDSKKYFDNFDKHGHKCGDHVDLIDGMPTGAVRISFGYATTKKDIDYFINFLSENFIEHKNILTVEKNDAKSIEKQFFKVTQIFIYPIKSCRAMQIESSWPIIHGIGFFYDRCFIIIDSNGIPLSQKRCPNLTKLQPIINLDAEKMILKFDNQSFEIDLKDNKENKTIIYANKTAGYDQGEEVADWLTKVFNLNEKCRLLKICSDNESIGSFANKAEYLLISENSVRKLRKFLVDNLDEDLKLSLNMANMKQVDNFLLQQFRPNIVVSIENENDELDFYEELWNNIRLLNKKTSFKIVNNCTRCQMININQNSTDKNTNDFSFLCSSLLKQVYKLKSNSKFGIYLGQIESKLEKKVSFDVFDLSTQVRIGDIGIAQFYDNDKF